MMDKVQSLAMHLSLFTLSIVVTVLLHDDIIMLNAV